MVKRQDTHLLPHKTQLDGRKSAKLTKSAIVVGLQWGDEGKGKVIDAIALEYDYVVRWNGGNNAGHTVVVDGEKYPLSLIPSGVIQGRKLLIAQGVVINPKILLDEIHFLENKGYKIHLTIDPRCHIVMPYHQLMDKANELWKGKDATGSLHLGIGYCYEDRNNRAGIRLELLLQPKLLKDRLEKLVPLKRAIIEKVYGMNVQLHIKSIFQEYAMYGQKLKQYIGDVSSIVSRQMKTHAFLFEQAHGTMLDPVFGTYPFTVAPPTIASAVFSGVGIAAESLRTIGVMKAYTTRVGNGPLPTELNNKTGEAIRTSGHEFGTVSKRPRRVGWLDLPQLRYAVRLNGCTELTVTKLDVLSGLSRINVCVGYRERGVNVHEFPDSISRLSVMRPVYREFPGWNAPLAGTKRIKDLPKNAQAYLAFVERELGCPIRFISVGAERKEFIKV